MGQGGEVSGWANKAGREVSGWANKAGGEVSGWAGAEAAGAGPDADDL